MTPLVTVGIPFHNEVQFLRETVESILCQTTSSLEVLLIDDGSSDQSVEVARSFTNDPRVRLLVDGVRRRLPARLNQIVREARGRFIARMDADDISHPDRLTRELRLFEQNGSLDAVGTWCALIDVRRRAFAVGTPVPERSRRLALVQGLFVHPTVLGRTEWFRANPYNEELYRAEDRELWCRTVESSRFDVVPEPLHLHRVLPRGVDFLVDYRESQRQNRVLYSRYGPSAVGLMGTMTGYLGTFAKSAVMTGAIKLGVADRLVQRRGRRPTIEEARLIREALEAASPSLPPSGSRRRSGSG